MRAGWPPFALCVAATFALAAGLRVGEQPSLNQFWSRVTEPERAAMNAGTCGKDAVPLDLARDAGNGVVGSAEKVTADCDELIPRYDMVEWMKMHHGATPDHPAIFTNTKTHEAEVFPSMEAFLELHGDEEVTALPEYAQSGGHMKTPNAQGRVTASYNELAKQWNETFVYFSDFKCEKGSLCDRSSKQFGSPKLFHSLFFQSKNFLVGGPDSGLPFHKHGMTWQGLSMGRKAWYLLPPGSMSEEVHDATGPYLFPVRAFHSVMVGREVGKRPLYCVQHPGEIFYVPASWWHATMNLDRFQVAYGEKPSVMPEQSRRSPTLAKILEIYPQQPFDAAGYTAKLAAGDHETERPMPYSLQARMKYLKDTCEEVANTTEHGFDEAMQRIETAASTSKLAACGAAETFAFAHCHCARSIERVLGRANECGFSSDYVAALKERRDRWLATAGTLSPSLVAREFKYCHRL